MNDDLRYDSLMIISNFLVALYFKLVMKVLIP